MTGYEVILLHLYKRRLLYSASLVSVGTPSIEPTTWRWIDRARDLATNHICSPVTRIGHRDSSDQSASVRVRGRIHHHSRRGHLHHLTQIQYYDAVANVFGDS